MSIVHIQDINFKLTFGKKGNNKLCILFNNTEEVNIEGYTSGQKYHLPTLIKDIKKTMNQYFRENNIDLELDFRKVYHYLFDFHVTSMSLFKASINAQRINGNAHIDNDKYIRSSTTAKKQKRRFISYYDPKNPLKFHAIYYQHLPKDGSKGTKQHVYQFPLLICNKPKIEYRPLMKSDLEVYIPRFDEVDTLAEFKDINDEPRKIRERQKEYQKEYKRQVEQIQFEKERARRKREEERKARAYGYDYGLNK